MNKIINNKRKSEFESESQIICLDISNDDIQMNSKRSCKNENHQDHSEAKFEDEKYKNQIPQKIVLDISSEEENCSMEQEEGQEGQKGQDEQDEDEEEGQEGQEEEEEEGQEEEEEEGQDESDDDEKTKSCLMNVPSYMLTKEFIEDSIVKGADIDYINSTLECNLGHFVFSSRRLPSEDVISTLVKKGLDLNHLDLDGDTPFSVYCMRDDVSLSVVKMFVEAKADPNIHVKSGKWEAKSLLSLLLSKKKIPFEIVEYLLDLGSPFGLNEFDALCGSSGLTEPIFCSLLPRVVDLEVQDLERSLCSLVNNRDDRVTKGMLEMAYKILKEIDLSKILKSYLVNINKIDVDVLGFLYSKMVQEYECSEKISGGYQGCQSNDSSIKLNVKKPDPTKILEKTCDKNLTCSVLKFFLDQKAELTDDIRETVLEQETMHGKEMFDLLDQHTSSWESDRYAPLALLSSWEKVTNDMLVSMINKGAKVHAEQGDEISALTSICFNESVSLEMIKTLVDNKADVNFIPGADDDNSLTALLSNPRSTFEMFEYLHKEGAILFEYDNKCSNEGENLSEDEEYDKCSKVAKLWMSNYMTKERIEWLVDEYNKKGLNLTKLLFTKKCFEIFIESERVSYERFLYFEEKMKEHGVSIVFPKSLGGLHLFVNENFSLEFLDHLVKGKYIKLSYDLFLMICKGRNCSVEMANYIISRTKKSEQKKMLLEELFRHTEIPLERFEDLVIPEGCHHTIIHSVMKNENAGLSQIEYLTKSRFSKWNEMSTEDKTNALKLLYKRVTLDADVVAYTIKTSLSPIEQLELFLEITSDKLLPLLLIKEVSGHEDLVQNLVGFVLYNMGKIESQFHIFKEEKRVSLLKNYPSLSVFFANQKHFSIDEKTLSKYVELVKK